MILNQQPADLVRISVHPDPFGGVTISALDIDCSSIEVPAPAGAETIRRAMARWLDGIVDEAVAIEIVERPSADRLGGLYSTLLRCCVSRGRFVPTAARNPLLRWLGPVLKLHRP